MKQSPLWHVAALLGTAGIAVYLRVSAYMKNPSFSTDEAQLALNVIDRSAPQLINRLDFNQGAPPGFLLAQKAASSVFGTGELAFRAIPIVAAAAAVGVFYAFAREIVDTRTLVVALCIFATSSPLILFGNTAKPYSVDVLIATVLYLAGIRALHRRRLRDIVVFGAVGALSVWVSYPAVFFLTGITLVLGIAFRHDRRALVTLGVVTIGLAVGFGGSYVVARTALVHVKSSLNLGGIDPLTTSSDLTEVLRSAAGGFRYVLGIGHLRTAGIDFGDLAAIVFAVFFLVGFRMMFRSNRIETLLVATPLLVGALGVITREYPIYPRTLLFVTPAVIIFVSVTIAAILDLPRRAWRLALSPIVIVLLVFIVAPGIDAAVSPSEREGLRPVMKSLTSRVHDTEGVYLYYSTQYGFRYYIGCRCFGSRSAADRARRLWPVQRTGGPEQWDPALQSLTPKLVVGRRLGLNVQDQIPDLARIPRRTAVWILLGEMDPGDRELFLRCLDRVGTRRTSVAGTNGPRAAQAYLYAFEPNVSGTLPAHVRTNCSEG